MSDGEFTWNHRLVNRPSTNGGEDMFYFAEVHYEADGSISGASTPFLESETPEGMVLLANWLLQAAKEPALHENDVCFYTGDEDEDENK